MPLLLCVNYKLARETRGWTKKRKEHANKSSLRMLVPGTHCTNTRRCFAVLFSADIVVMCFTPDVDCEVPLQRSRHHSHERDPFETTCKNNQQTATMPKTYSFSTFSQLNKTGNLKTKCPKYKDT